jgi:hypothetical protein
MKERARMQAIGKRAPLWFCLAVLISVAIIFSGASLVNAQEDPTMPLSGLGIGDRVVDRSWKWEFRTGYNYSGNGEVKEVVWIVVAKDHPGYPQGSVTLMTEECIASLAFDYHLQLYFNHWGESGKSDPDKFGVRPFLNSLSYGCPAGASGFYDAFSPRFKRVIYKTTVCNATMFNPFPELWGSEWRPYDTEDCVFLPSVDELGITKEDCVENTCKIGSVLEYFALEDAAYRRVVQGSIFGNLYWTRSPFNEKNKVMTVNPGNGEYAGATATNYEKGMLLRPILNIKGTVQVNSTSDENGKYEIDWPDYICGDVNGDDDVNVADAIMVLRSIVGLEQLSTDQEKRADAYHDGEINVVDAIAILRFNTQLIDELPVYPQ